MMVWRLLSFWDGLFSGAMLNFQGVCRFTRPLWKPWRFSSCLSFPFFKCKTRKTKVDTKMIASDLQSWWVFSCFSPHVGMVWYIVLDAQCFVEFPLWHFSGCQNDPDFFAATDVLVKQKRNFLRRTSESRLPVVRRHGGPEGKVPWN